MTVLRIICQQLKTRKPRLPEADQLLPGLSALFGENAEGSNLFAKFADLLLLDTRQGRIYRARIIATKVVDHF